MEIFFFDLEWKKNKKKDENDEKFFDIEIKQFLFSLQFFSRIEMSKGFEYFWFPQRRSSKGDN